MRYPRAAFLAALLLLSPAAFAEPLPISVTSAEPFLDQSTGEPAISFVMTEESALAFEALTEAHVGETMAFRLDGVTVMSPVIREPIRGGRGIIGGSMTLDEIRDLAARIASGAVRIEVEVVDPYEGLPVLPSMR